MNRNRPLQMPGSSPPAGARASPERGPFGAMEARLLERAGFNLNDPAQVNWGRMALDVARHVQTYIQRAGRQPTRGGVVPGRNEACPCASGRKYKKCCMVSDAAQATRPALADAGLVPELVPRFGSMDGMREDIRLLSRLFERDEGLRQVRFDADALLAFIDREGIDLAEDATEEAKGERADELAQAFGMTAAGRLPANLTERLLDAAVRARGNPDDLRAVAMGLMLRAADDTPGGRESSLLSPLVFRLTMRERVDEVELLRDVRAAMPTPAQARAKLADPQAMADMAKQNTALLQSAAGKRLVTQVMAEFDGIIRAIEKGSLRLALPLVSALPTLVAMQGPAQDPAKTSPAQLKAIRSGLDTVGEDDWRLLQTGIRATLDANEATPDMSDLVRTQMTQVEGLLLVGQTDHLVWPLFQASIQYGPLALLPGEDDLLAAVVDPLSSEFLSDYGDLLAAAGWPRLALRTWRLCKAPMPAAVATRIAELAAGV